MTSRPRFHFLFLGLLALLFVEPFLDGAPNAGSLIQLAFSLVLVTGVFSLASGSRVYPLGLGLALVGFFAGVGYYATGSQLLRIVDLVAVLGFCVLVVIVAVRHVVMAAGPVDWNRVVGGLCIYLLLGVVWAILFGLVEIALPDAFRYAGGRPADPLQHFLYYSFVTLTTLGFGDVTPVHAVARTLSYLEAVVGQLFIAVLIAGLIGARIAERGPARDPAEGREATRG